MGSTFLKDIKDYKLLISIFYEFLGTYFLVLISIGSGSYDPKDTSPKGFIRTPFAVGLTLATIIWIGSPVSGSHVNPVVSFGLLITQKLNLIRLLLYTGFQLMRGIFAAYTIKYVSPPGFNDLVGAQLLGDNVTWYQGFIIEILATFLLVFVIFASIDATRQSLDGSRALIVGLTATLCHLWALPFTGCAMNPARAFGSHIASGAIYSHNYIWIYWAGPYLGSLLASFSYFFLFDGDSSVKKIKNYFSNFSRLYNIFFFKNGCY